MTTILSTWDRPGEVAIHAAWKTRMAGGSLLDSVEAGLAAGELDPELIAIGLGSIPNSKGIIELDASIMDGADLRSGAVCAVKDIVPVISVARKVMEETEHAMLAGDAAREFAISKGFTPRDLQTDDSRHRYADWLERQPSIPEYVHSVDDKVGDTITMLALEEGSKCVAASSTSGMPFKLPGRVGDSPIIGGGIYADNEIGCAGATGYGEALLREVSAFRAVSLMDRGMSAQEACEEAIRHLVRRQSHMLKLPSVVFAMRNDGDIGAATVGCEFQLWICRDGEIRMERFASLI